MFSRFARFVIPSICSMWIYSLYTMVDGIFVAVGVGEQALASVNLSMPYVLFVFAVGNLMGAGAATLIGIYLGQQEEKTADGLFTLNFLVAAVVSGVLTALSLRFLTPLAYFLGADAGNLEEVRTYVGTIAGFAVFFILSYNMETLVKTDGRPLVATVSVSACGLSNVILDYIFVIRLHQGVFGAAFATGISQVISTVIFAVYFLRKSKRLHLTRLRGELAIPKLLPRYVRVFSLGFASFIAEMSSGVVVFLYNHVILAVIGREGVVSYTILSYVGTIVTNTMAGVAQGVNPLLSYAFGAGLRDDVKRYFRLAVRTAVILGAAAFLLSEAGAPVIVGLFLDPSDGEVVAESVRALRLYAVAFLFIWSGIVVGGYLTATEHAAMAFALSISRGLIFLLISLILMTYFFGETGIWLAAAVSEAACGLLALGCLGRVHRKNEGKFT